MKQVVRVAAGQGFWGDWLEAPRRQVEGGPVDYLMLDYLAEVTMSILQKQRRRDPKFLIRQRMPHGELRRVQHGAYGVSCSI